MTSSAEHLEKQRTRQLNVRITDFDYRRLKDLRIITGNGVSEILRTLIGQAHDKLTPLERKSIEHAEKAGKRILK
jgi:hypothetical protein